MCLFHTRCGKMNKQLATRFIKELTSFFIHTGELTTYWSAKEKYHLIEVRNILDILAMTAVVFIILFFLTVQRKNLSTQARLNVFITSGLVVLIPFFNIFWTGVFHPLLFKNDLWLNTPKDVSFYIMPGVFFKYSMVFLIIATIIINGAIWFFFRKKSATKSGISSIEEEMVVNGGKKFRF